MLKFAYLESGAPNIPAAVALLKSYFSRFVWDVCVSMRLGPAMHDHFTSKVIKVHTESISAPLKLRMMTHCGFFIGRITLGCSHKLTLPLPNFRSTSNNAFRLMLGG